MKNGTTIGDGTKAAALNRSVHSVPPVTPVPPEAAKPAPTAAAEKRLMRWLRANSGRDPVTEAPRAIREAAGFRDEHKRERRNPNLVCDLFGFRRKGKHEKVRTLWTREIKTTELSGERKAKTLRLREVSLHSTRGFRSRSA